MRPGRLLLLALAVIALGAFIYFVERHGPTTNELAERQDKLYPTFERDDAERIVLTNSYGRFELVKEGEAWKLLQPVTDEGNSSTVSSLLSALVNLKAERALEAGEVNLADYGLEEPELTVIVTSTAGEEIALKLGGELPLGDTRAALTTGGHVFLVKKYVADSLNKGLAEWRSNDLTQIYASDVASLTIRDLAGRVSLAHAGSVWSLTEPIADLADRERAEGVISDINATQIKEFLDAEPDLRELGLEPPHFEITIVRSDGKPPIQLAFGIEREESGSAQRACRRGERVYWVEASATSRADTSLAAWRSPSLVKLDTWSADRLELEAGGHTVTLQRDDGVWKAGDVEVDYNAVASRLSALSDMQVLSFDRPRPAGETSGRVKVTTSDGTEIEAAFYPGDGEGEVIALVPGRSGAMAVDAAEVAELLADPPSLALPKPTPTPVPTPTEEAEESAETGS